MKGRLITIAVIGFTVMAVTVILTSLLPIDWVGITGTAYAAALWSEFVLFAGFAAVEILSDKTEEIITRTSIYAALAAYSSVNFVVSLLFMVFFKDSEKSFTAVQVLLFAALVIALTVILWLSRTVGQSANKTLAATRRIQDFIKRLGVLSAVPVLEPCKKEFEALADDLRYADASINVDEDDLIEAQIEGLEAEVQTPSPEFAMNVRAALVQLKSLVAQRRYSVKPLKRGRI
jgi:hypothetical protein